MERLILGVSAGLREEETGAELGIMAAGMGGSILYVLGYLCMYPCEGGALYKRTLPSTSMQFSTAPRAFFAETPEKGTGEVTGTDSSLCPLPCAVLLYFVRMKAGSEGGEFHHFPLILRRPLS